MSAHPLVRDTFRPLLRRKGLTVTILVMLALGVGVNAGIFSIFQQVLLQKLPIDQPDAVYALSSPGPKQGMNSSDGTGRDEYVFSYSMWQDLQAVDASHGGLAGFRNFGANLGFEGRTASASGSFVTANYFDVLGLSPSAGRLFRSMEFSNAGEGAGVVLAYPYWQREFGADPAAVGQTLVINGRAMNIIGVAPPKFVGVNRFSPVDVFVPITVVSELSDMSWQLETRNNYWLYLITRLADGVSPQQVLSILEPRYRAIVREFDAPLLNEVSDQWRQRFLARGLELESIGSGMSRTSDVARAPLTLLLAVTALVLLVACVNIANLLLAMAISDRGETAVRMALGAGRRTVLRRQLLQLGVLALLGALACVPVAVVTLHLVLSLIPDFARGPLSANLDWRVLATGLGISAGAMLLAGAAPLVQAISNRPLAAIREQSGRSGASRFSSRLRSTLVTGQIALALTLLVVSGLFIHSLVNVARVDLGMDIDRVVTFAVSPSQNGYPPERSAALFRDLEQRLNELPGVESASVSMVPLLTDSNWDNSVSVEGFEASPDTNTASSLNVVGSRYFDTLSIPLLAGRTFTAQDTEGRPRVAIVNRAFAEKFEMGDSVVGSRMARASGSNVELDIEIVGLVADAHYSTIKDVPPPQFFIPIGQQPQLGSAVFYARTQGDPDTLMAAVGPLVAEFDPNLPVVGLSTLKHVSVETILLERLMGTLAGLFAGLATLLAAAGLFGVLNFSMAQRSSELGLRAALGASPDALQRMMLRHALIMAFSGIVIGSGLALVLGRLSAGLLYGVSAFEPLILAAASSILLAVVLLAGWLPARRAAAVQPVQALRYE
ncbi:MAG: ADOP family duplicated permease [Wenzhouxiangella sp.]|jgi:predicted permease|nr:ADOP family duplicated permease [Wenzhouxiangella sp.]